MRHDSRQARERSRPILGVLLACAAVLGSAATATAKLDPAEQQRLKRLDVLDPTSLQALEHSASAEAMEREVRTLLSLEPAGNLAIGSRVYDEDNEAAIHRYLKRRIDDAGLERLGGLRGFVAVPIPLDRRQTEGRRDRAELTVGGGGDAPGESYPVLPIWPNGAMPTLAPAGGLTGPLIDCGEGEWADVNGKALDGAICLMRFRGGRNWEQKLANFGAAAVIVLEDPFVTRETAERLFSTTPVPLPRYYADAETAAKLVEAAAAERPPTATLTGGHVYENRPFQSVFAYLPPTDPIRYTVEPDDLLKRLAIEYGTTVGKLRQRNPALSGAARPASLGQVDLVLPGPEKKTLELAADELFKRIAEDAGNERSAILQANPWLLSRVASENQVSEDEAVELIDTAGKLSVTLDAGDPPLVLPNLDESVVIMAPIDSVSTVPGAPHGLKVATNLAATLTLMDNLAGDRGVVRRKGVVFAFLDAERTGGLSSRTLAEYVLKAENEFGGLAGQETGGISLGLFIVIALLLTAAGTGLTYVLTGRDIDGRAARVGRKRAVALRAAPAWLVLGLAAGYLPQLFYAESQAVQAGEQPTVAWYEQATAAWAGQPAEFSDESGRWFTEQWLWGRLEAARDIAFTTRRELGVERRGLPEDAEDRRETLTREQQRLADWDRNLVRIRRVLGDRDLDWNERVNRFHELVRMDTAALAEQIDGWDKVSGSLAEFGLTEEAITQRLAMELREERAVTSAEQQNPALIAALRERLRPGNPGGTDPVLGWSPDISAGSATLAVKTGGQRFRLAPSGQSIGAALSKQFREIIRYVDREQGVTENVGLGFLGEEDAAVHPMSHTDSPPMYDDFWTPLHVATVPIGTINDAQSRLDTPWDVADRPAMATATAAATQPSGGGKPWVAWGDVAKQTRNLTLLIRLGIESPPYSEGPNDLTADKFGRLAGRTLRFNARSGIDAQEPVANAWVFYPASSKKLAITAHNPQVFLGARRGIVRITRLSGAYELPLETLKFAAAKVGDPKVHAYWLDEEQAVFTRVVNRGQVGTQAQQPEFTLTPGRVTVKDLVLTDVYPLVLFPGPDPVDYQTIGGDRGPETIEVIDAVTDGAPRHYGLDNPSKQYDEKGLTANILYMEPGRRVRVAAKKIGAYKLLLAGPVAGPGVKNDPRARLVAEAEDIGVGIDPTKGIGYRVGPVTAVNGQGEQVVVDRNLALRLTDQQAAEDMLAVAENLYTIMRDKGVRDQGVLDALKEARARVESARDHAEQHQWQATLGQSREAWGILVKYYPRLTALGREAVFSAVFLMAMLVPASYFLERLVIGRKGVVGRLVGTVVIFALLAGYLNIVHPAFQISVSPFIVMVAFTMILMSVIVMLICYQRFEVLVRRAKASSGEVEGEKISLAGSLGTALGLGVSNLKKRPTRTWLTAFTVTVLTFSIVTFVSVSGEDDLYTQPLNLATTASGQPVEPLPPAYAGAVFRQFMHTDLDPAFIDALRSEFGSEYELTVRGFSLKTEGGNNMDREGVNQVPVRFNKDKIVLTGAMTYQPNEPRFSGLNAAVSNRQWFSPEGRHEIILPDTALKPKDPFGLPIDPSMLYDGTPEQIAAGEAELKPDGQLPKVIMAGHAWKVIGILDVAHANRIRDVTGQPLSMVDHLRSGFTRNAAQGDLVNEPDAYHMSFEHLMLLPEAGGDDLSTPAKPRAVAIRFDDAEHAKAFYDRIVLRLNTAIYGTRFADAAADAPATLPGYAPFDRPASLAMVTTQSKTDFAGLAKVIVPVILCVLIVLNTMLGNVEERKGEVNMLGAVGLSPAQISFLLLSESAVFSVLGIVMGMLAGLGFGWLTHQLNPGNDPDGFMGGLSLNFASLTSLGLACTAGIVVLVATLIPARKAARLAAPSGMERWELPEPTPDGRIDFTLPFTLTRGNAVGMTAFFRQFLTNHTDPAAEGFNCRDIGLTVHGSGNGNGNGQAAADQPEPDDRLAVSSRMWLAPYDLDVAQRMSMEVRPIEDDRVFGVRLRLTRTSGTEEAWVRTNYRFLDMVRRQFLLWRNLAPEARKDYIRQGTGLVREAMAKGTDDA